MICLRLVQRGNLQRRHQACFVDLFHRGHREPAETASQIHQRPVVVRLAKASTCRICSSFGWFLEARAIGEETISTPGIPFETSAFQ